MDEIIDYKRISDAKRGYLTPRRLDNLKCKVRCAEHAAETLAKLERGENFDDIVPLLPRTGNQRGGRLNSGL